MKREGFKKKKGTLAYGTVTGHSHKLASAVLVKENSAGLVTELKIDEPVKLVHEEHDTLVLPKGNARVVMQREVDLLGKVQQVMD